MVEYDKNAATFSCIFNDKNDTMKKSCIISYSQYGNVSRNELEAESTEESPDRVLLQLPSDSIDHQSLCYSITATNGVQTVIVEDCNCIDNVISEYHFLKFSMIIMIIFIGNNSQRNKIIAAVSAIVVFLVLLSIIIIVVCLLVRWRAAVKESIKSDCEFSSYSKVKFVILLL
jgi:hypothetical protein